MKTPVSPRVLAVALLGMMTVPVASQNLLGQVVVSDERYSIFRSQDDEGRLFQGEDIREDVIEHRASFRAQRRAYSRAIERCRDRLRDGEDIECPDFNDADSYQEDFIHAAAPEPVAKEAVEARPAPSMRATARSTVRQLSTSEREQLRTYTRAGYCSKVMSDMLYTLCKAIVGEEEEETPVGIINDNVYLHGRNAAPPTTLKLRLQMMDEAISGSRGRRPNQVRYRYQGGVSQ